jgi:putative transposase
MARFLPAEIEPLVVLERLHLYNRGVPCGAQAIRQRLERLGFLPLPSVRSIQRILSRNGLTHRRTGIYSDPDLYTPLLPPVDLS